MKIDAARLALASPENVSPSSETRATDLIELLQDVHRGLADAEAGRVVPHEEALARLMTRYR